MKFKIFVEDTELFNGIITKIKYINSRFIRPSEKEFFAQRQSLKWWLEDHPGETKEDWAKYWLKNSKPIPVDWMGLNGWDMDIHDGHHRFMAYKILGLMPKVIITATNVPISRIESLIREDQLNGGRSFIKGGIDEE